LPATLQAIQLFTSATREDPDFASAYAALADAQSVLMDYGYAPTAELLNEARQYAERAISIQPGSADGYVSLAAVRQMTWDWRGAEESYRRAISLNPNLPRARRWYAGLLIQFGRFEEAIREGEEALRLDPYDFPNHSGHGLYLFYAGRYKDAVAQLEKTLSQKDLVSAHIVLGDTYARLGSLATGPEADAYFAKAFQEAAAVAQKERDAVRATTGRVEVLTYSHPMYALYYALKGDREKSLSYVNQLLPAVQAGRVSPVAVARIYSVLGEHSAALQYLEDAIRDRDRQLQYIHVSPFFAPLRGTERFRAILETMKLQFT
jgi:tetratricopeptide (TPR) repeat protein